MNTTISMVRNTARYKRTVTKTPSASFAVNCTGCPQQ